MSIYKPKGGRCPRDRRSRSVRSQRCSGPPPARAPHSDSPTRAPWRGSWGRRLETLGPQSQARSCSENVKFHASPESAGADQSENVQKKSSEWMNEWRTFFFFCYANYFSELKMAKKSCSFSKWNWENMDKRSEKMKICFIWCFSSSVISSYTTL